MNPRPQFTLEIDDRKVRLGERTVVMGVINVTPDSFSDGGRFLDPQRAVRHGLEMVRQGADWLDVGGESTRPGARAVAAEVELNRVLPVIRGLRQKLRAVPISIDTTKAEVAEQAVREGATVINDVSGLRFDPPLAEVARRHRTPLVLMHMRGRPETMQQKPFARSVRPSVYRGLARSILRALSLGVRRSQLIIDPGMGFGKSRRQNFELLAHLDQLQRFGLPVLVATSRKSFIQAVVAGEGLVPSKKKTTPTASHWLLTRNARARRAVPLPLSLGDAATVAATILAGAHIVRVHNVAAVLPAVRIADAILAAR